MENVKRKSKGLSVLGEEEYKIEIFNKNYQWVMEEIITDLFKFYWSKYNLSMKIKHI